MRRFAVAYIEALAEGTASGGIRDRDIAKQAGVTAQTVSVWRNGTPGFNTWVGDEIRVYVGHRWPAVKAVALRFALRGSIEHMKFLRELLEPAPERSPQSPGAPRGLIERMVIVNLPAPPSELQGHPMVMGLLEQVAASAGSNAVGG